MAEILGRRPAEIFGYPVENSSEAAKDARRRYWCPYRDGRCKKKSRLIDFPFGVCSVAYGDGIRTVCPHRFEEHGSIGGVPRVLEDIALHHFGTTDNIVVFPEVRLPNVGSIDYVIIKHKTMQSTVDEFVTVEFQADSTTGTGQLVRGISDFYEGRDLQSQSYRFGMNTYDSLKRAITQLLNKGIVYETWNSKCYWVLQGYIYTNLVRRYGFKENGFSPNHASVFALYDVVKTGDRLTLAHIRFVSASVEEIYQAMRNNPAVPNKDVFVEKLNEKLRLRLCMT